MGNEEKVLAMPAEKLVSLLVAKAERKGRTEAEVYETIRVLMGYEKDSLEQLFAQKADYRTFLLSAPSYDPGWKNVKGTVCGIRVESIENELIRKMRVLDKLVDDLAKGLSIERILSFSHSSR